jgi:hypothetical protein
MSIDQTRNNALDQKPGMWLRQAKYGSSSDPGTPRNCLGTSHTVVP